MAETPSVVTHPQQGQQQGGQKAPGQQAGQCAATAQQVLYPCPGAIVGQWRHARRQAHDVVDVHGPDGRRPQTLLEV